MHASLVLHHCRARDDLLHVSGGRRSKAEVVVARALIESDHHGVAFAKTNVQDLNDQRCQLRRLPFKRTCTYLDLLQSHKEPIGRKHEHAVGVQRHRQLRRGAGVHEVERQPAQRSLCRDLQQRRRRCDAGLRDDIASVIPRPEHGRGRATAGT